jgi:hypothetical protein
VFAAGLRVVHPAVRLRGLGLTAPIAPQLTRSRTKAMVRMVRRDADRTVAPIGG